MSNHVASVDDPFVIASLLPPRVLLDAQNLRWALCATDRCFCNLVTSAFFYSVKVLPRGDGIYQEVLLSLSSYFFHYVETCTLLKVLCRTIIY